MTGLSPDKLALFDYCLWLGDNSLVLGERLAEWCGHAPALELDLALTNLSLDLIGQGQAWLGYAGEIEGKSRSADDLAFSRDVTDFRNLLLVEQPNGDWGQTIARQYLFSTWQLLLLNALKGSSDKHVAALAEKTAKECAYHQDFAADWIMRLGDGTEESNARLQTGINNLWRFTGELFETSELHQRLVDSGTVVQNEALETRWSAAVEAIFDAAKLTRPEVRMMIGGGKAGHHTEHLGHILAELQFMQRAYPGAKW